MITKINDLYRRTSFFPLFTFLILASCSSDDGYQSRLRELILDDMAFTCDGGTQEQTFRHEDLSAYTVASKQPWCVSQLDINNSKLIVTVSPNDTYDARRDTVTLTDINSRATRSFVVTQSRRTGLFVDQTLFEVPMEGGTVTASLKSNVSYEVKIPDSCKWVTITEPAATRGLEPSVITFLVSENKGYRNREAIITVVNTVENLTDKITIRQPFVTTFKADSTAFEVPMEGGDITVNVESNIPYTVTIPDTCKWITSAATPTRSHSADDAGSTRAAETKALTFHVKENKGYHARDGVIIISNEEAGASIQVNVHQPFTTIFKADKKAFDVPMEGGTVTINMESNVSYSVQLPDGCDWITRPATSRTRGVEASVVELKVAQNKSYHDREAVVVISNKDAGAEVKVTISQPFTTVFKVDNTAFDVPMDGGTVTVNLESNVSHTVSIPSDCDWITMPTATRRNSRATRATRAASTTPIVFRVSENTTYHDREAVVTISNKDAGAEVKIYIHQPFTPVFKVDKAEAEVPMEGGIVTASVESNISYDVKIPSGCNWITLSSSSRSRSRAAKASVIMLSVAANTSGRNRSATITIGNTTLGVSAGLTITQPFTPNFIVDVAPLEIDERGGTLNVSVAANVPVTVQSLNDWITVGNKTNVGDGYWTQQIVVAPLTDKAAQRTGNVKFIYPAANQTMLVPVTQTRTLFISETAFTLTEAGQTQALTLQNTLSRTVTWTSSDTKVATVSGTGIVTAVANGQAVITVKSADGRYSDKATVTVNIPEPPQEEVKEPEKEEDETPEASETEEKTAEE